MHLVQFLVTCLMSVYEEVLAWLLNDQGSSPGIYFLGQKKMHLFQRSMSKVFLQIPVRFEAIEGFHFFRLDASPHMGVELGLDASWNY